MAFEMAAQYQKVREDYDEVMTPDGIARWTARERLAAMVLAGLAANPRAWDEMGNSDMAAQAFNLADALIAHAEKDDG